MKKIPCYMVVLVVILLSAACKKEEDRGFKTSYEYMPSFTSDQWNVKGFLKNGVYETDKFEKDPIHFSEDYEILIDHKGQRYQGEWSVKSIETEDMPPDDLNFIIHFESPIFSDFNGSWVINDRTMSEISLSRANAIGENDTLVFSKL